MTDRKLPISELSFIPRLVKDYLEGRESLRKHYTFEPNEEGLLKSMNSKASQFNQREMLARIVEHNYRDLKNINEAVQNNLKVLEKNGLAVTTAHQPNLFLGPFYMITKAVSAIALANKLNAIQNTYPVVPVFVIGSEDHDRDELLQVSLYGKGHQWNTAQKGSIGSMKVDGTLTELLEEFLGKLSKNENGDKLRHIFRNAYREGQTMARACAEVLNALFGEQGLIILDINIPEVKQFMHPVFRMELQENFAKTAAKDTIEFLEEHYTVQAGVTDYNLFEYHNEERIKIKKSTKELLKKLDADPSSFSPSVILRPLMQQMVIPSIANIGGAAEVAYWLELKGIFDKAGVDLPVILMRDLYSVLDEKSWKKWTESGLNKNDFFLSPDELNKKLIDLENGLAEKMNHRKSEISGLFQNIAKEVQAIDPTLKASAEAERVRAIQSVEHIYSKLTRSIKQKEEARLNQIGKIKNNVFEGDALMERRENFASYYDRYGESCIQQMINRLNPLMPGWILDIL